MDLDQLKKILDLVREHELAEFEIEHDGLRLKIRKDSAGTLMTVPAAPTMEQAPAGGPRCGGCAHRRAAGRRGGVGPG